MAGRPATMSQPTAHSRRFTRRWIAGLAACAAAGVAALAVSPVHAAPAAATGWVRFGHFAPSQAPVDLYVDGAQAAAGVAFKGVSDYLPLPSGTHRFAVKPSGATTAPDILSVEAGVPGNSSITIAAVTTRDGLSTQVYDDALQPPPGGQSLVRFIHSAPDVPSVDIAVANGGPILAAAVTYPGATAYQPVAAGTYDVDVREAGTPRVVLHIAAWSIQSGVQASVIIVRGLDGNLDVVPVVDAAAASLAPVGGVQTGYGGMAPPAPSSSPVPWVLLAVGVVGAAGSALRLRARRVAPSRALQ